ncbi:hypothetical protein CFAM422_011119 [Trichoderma lentiforme]|uniref:Uncharacterized protein n=1 Tax=Trichoderma lentiforme TaxID=1567552 RepID=A0A9P4X6E6_9HYPO|nr:hypothetical protein CFAM422_011119 [Trichoderma lentiforme]
MIGGAAPPVRMGWKGSLAGRPISAAVCPQPTCSSAHTKSRQLAGHRKPTVPIEQDSGAREKSKSERCLTGCSDVACGGWQWLMAMAAQLAVREALKRALKSSQELTKQAQSATSHLPRRQAPAAYPGKTWTAST